MAQLTKQQRLKIEEIIKRKFKRVYDRIESMVSDQCQEKIKEIEDEYGIAPYVKDLRWFIDAMDATLKCVQSNIRKIDEAVPDYQFGAAMSFDIDNISHAIDRLAKAVEDQLRDLAIHKLMPVYGLDRIRRFEEDALDSLWLASAGADVLNLVDQVDKQLQMFMEEATGTKEGVTKA